MSEAATRRALVTGADGFVGEHLVHELLEAGFDVTASALTLPPDRNTLSQEDSARVEWKVADVLDRAALFRLVAAVQPEHVYHLAGFSSGARAREDPEGAVRVNAGGTVNLMEAVLAARREFPELDPRILVIGSSRAYGVADPGEGGLREDVPLRPASPYGLSKACQEIVAHTYRRSHGLRALVARPFHLLGPGQREDFVLPAFCAQAAAIAAGTSDPVLEVGNLDVERDFLDVRDGARALRGLMGLREPGPAYNVCSGRPVTVRRLLEWVLDEAGVEAEVHVDTNRVRREPDRVFGDPSRLREQTGWTPSHELEETVRKTYRWMARRAG